METARTERLVVDATVVATRDLTPHARRVSFAGPDLHRVAGVRPAAWLVATFPVPGGGRPVRRAYTVRQFDPRTGVLDIDFVLHGDDGPASAWAASAAAGQTVLFSGPHDGYRLRADVPWRWLAGDETALPAIAAILEAAAVGVATTAWIEVPSADDRQALRLPAGVDVHWLPRDGRPGSRLVDAVRSAPPPAGVGQAFVAGEAAAVRSLERYLLDHLPADRVHAQCYWAAGTAAYRG